MYWTKEKYKDFINYLYSFQDLKYKKFHGKLLKEETNLIGIRVPILKNMAKEIIKNNPEEFLKVNSLTLYEEIMLYGLVISKMKISFNQTLSYLDTFLPYNNNWAINDTVCSSLKIWKKHKEEGFPVIKKYISSNNPWYIRFGLVLLLDYYIDDEYIDKVLEICTSIKNDEYYVKMANAWLISICYIKYKEKTLKIINTNKLDAFTHNKAIQKIRESYRVSKEDKDYLNTLKR